MTLQKKKVALTGNEMGQGQFCCHSAYHPLSVFSLLLAVQDLFTLNFKMKLMSYSKKIGFIFGQNNKSEVLNTLPYGDASTNKGAEKDFKGCVTHGAKEVVYLLMLLHSPQKLFCIYTS